MLALAPVDEGRNFEFLRLNQRWAASLIDAQLAGDPADSEPRPDRLDAQRALEAALDELSVDDGIAFFALARRSALTRLESQVMGLCLAQMIEPEVARGLGRLHAHGRPQVTPADVALLLLGNRSDARTQILMLLSAESRLRCACILEAPQLTWDGLIDSPLYLTRPCLAYLTGQAIHAPHYGLTRFSHDAAARAPKRAVVSERQAEQIYDVVASQAAYLHRGDPAIGTDDPWILVLLWGPTGAGKATFARELATQFFAGLVEIDGEVVVQLEAPHAAVREALGCAVIHGAMLLIENGQALLGARGVGRLLLDGLRASPACVVVTSTERDLGQTLEAGWSLVSRFARPGPEMGVELWKTHLPPGTPLTSDVDLEALCERYVLPGAAIARAARMAVAYSAADREPGISMALLEQAAAAQLDDDLGELVRTVYPSHQLEDLILPADDLQQIKGMIAAYDSWHHVMRRWGMASRLATGRCITGLFYGEPGTGKSFAAEVIAGVLGQPLHIVQLSGIVSGGISETARNLRDLFERARLHRSLLLFDDAGALFSRVAVHTAHDLATNTRAEQFLHELDRHTGLVLMTTHRTESIDPAFRRRILFCLELSQPDQDARRRIWQRLIPAQTPCAPDVDLPALASAYVLSGGEIKNAVLRASLAGYADRGELTQQHLMDACEREHASVRSAK
jgi:AAA+ superfamily predicted ATPase